MQKWESKLFFDHHKHVVFLKETCIKSALKQIKHLKNKSVKQHETIQH